jgi:hypothetical protein
MHSAAVFRLIADSCVCRCKACAGYHGQVNNSPRCGKKEKSKTFAQDVSVLESDDLKTETKKANTCLGVSLEHIERSKVQDNVKKKCVLLRL